MAESTVMPQGLEGRHAGITKVASRTVHDGTSVVPETAKLKEKLR